MSTPTPPVPPVYTAPDITKNWALEVSTALTGSPTYTPVWSLTALVPPVVNPTTTPAKTFDSGIWNAGNITTDLDYSVTGSVLRGKSGASSGAAAEDPGQAILRAASFPDPDTGQPSRISWRVYDKSGGDENYSGVGTVQWTATDASGLKGANFTINGVGELAQVDNPYA